MRFFGNFSSSCLVLIAFSTGGESLRAQEIPSAMDLQALRQAAQAQGAALSGPDATPRATTIRRENAPEPQALQDRRQAEDELRALKAGEKGPRRFASDLFDIRSSSPQGTEGGIAEDYVLGVGDQLQVNVFGSATFEIPAQVDGRGDLVVPKVGTVRVSGLSLAKARAAVQAKVAQNFSRTTVDLSVTKLREVRVFVLGEVYRPGSFLVPSLSSLVNVLSLAGGPTPSGSFRQIRVMRGGKAVHTVDLYPLRAEGLGNLNFSLQSGDTIFVPLVFHQVMLEGAFTRVVAEAEAFRQRNAAKSTEPGNGDDVAEGELPEEQRKLSRQIRRIEALLVPATPKAGAVAGMPVVPMGSQQVPRLESTAAGGALELKPMERVALEDQLQELRDRLRGLKIKNRTDMRVSEGEPLAQEALEQPQWLTDWRLDGKAPRMQFEMLPGETAADAMRYAGGLAVQAFSERLSLRRIGAGGALEVLDVPVSKDAATLQLHQGDVLSALPLRDQVERAVQVRGWARIPGTFARVDGLRVGDLLKRENQLLPDTYLGRGEIVRTAPGGNTSYLAFDVAKAVAEDPSHNLLLEDRDRVELYRLDDFRLRRTVKVLGPVSRPGTFDFHEGMRAADLLFRAGIPLQRADRFVAELAHTRDGKPSEIRSLDLRRLLSSEQQSPVELLDDSVNPRIEPFDQLSVFEKPDYRPHRVVKISGQVARPGSYSLDKEGMGLRDLVARAGGLTPESMPKGAIFLRRLGTLDPEKLKAQELAGIEATDPTGNDINEILERLGETKRQPLTGQLLKTPVLHGLTLGAVNRMVVNLPAVLEGDVQSDVTLLDGDEIVIPRQTDAAYVVGEAASPFATFKLKKGMSVRELLRLAGGTTRNADTWNIRLLKADGRILDSWVSGRKVEPGDAVLVPSKVRRDVSWQENLAAITNLAVMYAAIKR